MTVEPTSRREQADLPIADFDGWRFSRVIGIEADSIARRLPESGWAHRHTYYQIAYVTAGRGANVIDGCAYPLCPASLYFLRPDQVHFLDYRSPPSGYMLAFLEDFLLSQPCAEATARNAKIFSDLADAAQLRLTASQAREILPIIKAMVWEYHGGRSDYQSVMQAYLHILLARARRLLPADVPNTPAVSRSALLVRQFTDLVTRGVVAYHTVNEYSDHLGVTPSHLAETVKRATGRTPGQIIRSAHVVEAKRLLLHTEKYVAQVAHELGFKDTAYFGRFFKREVGVTPGQFRRQASAIVPVSTR